MFCNDQSVIFVHENARIDPMLYIIHHYHPDAVTFSSTNVLFSCMPPNVISPPNSYPHMFPSESLNMYDAATDKILNKWKGKVMRSI